MRITINTKNMNLFTISMKSKTELTLFTINYKKNNLQKNYIKIKSKYNLIVLTKCLLYVCIMYNNRCLFNIVIYHPICYVKSDELVENVHFY